MQVFNWIRPSPDRKMGRQESDSYVAADCDAMPEDGRLKARMTCSARREGTH